MDAAEDDDFGIGAGGLDTQPQGVTDEVGDVLDLRDLVVVGQDHGLALGFQFIDLLGDTQFKTSLMTPPPRTMPPS